MDAAGLDIVPRPLKLNYHNKVVPQRILELQNKSSYGCDIVIQFMLPHMMEYNGNFKLCLGMYCSETSNFKSSSWAERLNLMDGAIVCNDQMICAARESGVIVPIIKIPYGVDVKKFEKSYKPIPIPGIENTFVFYTIAEMGKRKNLKALLQAFHTEFEVNEPVSLVIKSHKYGMLPEECKKHIESDCKTIKRWLKIYPDEKYYKNEIIIPNILEEDGLCRLHSTCDCFVLPSYGEAWSLPAFDAMAFGKTAIVTNYGGFKEYIDDNNGWLVNCHEEQVIDVNDSFQDLYTARENWASVDIAHLRKCMRSAYSDSKLRNKKSELGIQRAYDFSYSVVGSIIKRELESYESQLFHQR